MFRLFWKLFLSFLFIVISVALISISINKIVVELSSEKSIDLIVDEITEFANKVADKLEQSDVIGARELLENNKEYKEQIFVYNQFGNEIFNRVNRKKSNRFTSRYNKHIGSEFKKRGVNLSATLISFFGEKFHIKIEPKIKYSFILSPTFVGSLTRSFLLLSISALICFFIARMITKRLSKLSKASKDIANGNYSIRLDKTKNRLKDELDILSSDFNVMAQKLEDSDNLKKHILSDISHELRSPLARMQVALEITRNAHPETEKQLQRIEKESIRMNDLIEKIITIQKMESDYQAKMKTQLNILELLKIVADDCNYEYQNKHKKVIVTTQLENSCFVFGEEKYLLSAFENIIRNAMSHTAKNTNVTVDISVDKKINMQKIIIEDSGTGIAENNLTKIFDPFTRLDSSRNRQTGGYGLGLSIAKAIISNHSGKIYAENIKLLNETKGLRVVVLLPLVF